ncbi:F-box/LRR-repeat protein fbxl-1-like isoform X2 [Coccinella septempunctata]|uniref:F-box/LRR-repeat protein fbxl-1-like isoform X2 n=1 Tax=Coccinella septempunctata TaxID=41139 RepID=UPI001D087748|nr:F-box/LRR-repeat protein fbxl-1-like isoform X2 [Coccinella septempunctata]
MDQTQSSICYSELMNSSESSLFRNEFEKNVKGFNRLPQHILLKIFSHLNEKDLHTVQQVCQRWKQGALNPSLWKNLKIQKLRTTGSVNMALQKIWMFGQLEKVYIKDVIEASALLRQVYRCLPNLQYLIIRYCNNLSAQTVRAVLRKCKQLKMLDLKGTTFKDSSIFDELPRLNYLKILNLSDNGNLTTKDMVDISLNCRNLEEFYVSSIRYDSSREQLTDEDCSFIVSNMSNNLKGFFIDGATLTDQCFQIKNNALNAVAECCPKLKKLIIKSCKNITDISCLQKCDSLAILNIAFCLKLSIDNFLPIQASIHIIFVDNGENLKKLEASLKEMPSNIKIRICHSQFRKSFEDYRIV